MGRKTNPVVLKIRYRKPHKIFGTRFVLSGNRKSKRRVKGRILSARKVSKEEIDKVGEFLNRAISWDEELPESLIR